MKNPFPGMNPWLELNWRETHARLVVYAGDQLQPKLPAGLRARVEEDVTLDADVDDNPGRLRPDVHVTEEWDGGTGSTAIAVADNRAAAGVIVMEEPFTQRRIEIIDRKGLVITAIEFLSPSNKEAGEGFRCYYDKQRTYMAGRVNLVEVDLLRAGSFALAFTRNNFTPKGRADYLACVFRARAPARRHVFAMSLREPLPVLPVPLRPADQEITLELQPLIDACCERGAYGPSDYAPALQPPLSPEDAAWAEALLHAHGLR
jgi:hypothetical protein